MSLLLITTAAVALLVLFGWWVYRNNLAVYPPGRGPLIRQPLPTGCDVGAQLMAASAVETTAGSAASGAGAEAATAPAPAPARKPPPRRKPSGPSRREFLRTAWLTSVIGSLTAFAGASIFFLWPTKRGGFGGIIEVGSVDDVLAEIDAGNGHYPYPSGRMYLVRYSPEEDAKGNYLEITQGGQSPVMAIYQKCVHLGCRVPWCDSSQWFECPCHGSRYNRWGEYEFGPAPRCLDRFSVLVQEGNIVVDTTNVVTGPPRSGGSLEQPPAGPHCN